VRVAAKTDDAEEAVSSGRVAAGSGDLELIQDGSTHQTVGLRFAGVTIPAGARISNAWLRFQVDEKKTTPAVVDVTIREQLIADAPTFTTSTRNISNRNPTGAAVPWDLPPWPTVGVSGAAEQSGNIASVIQEIVDGGGWASGHAMAILITGTAGTRTAESYEGQQDGGASAPRRIHELTGATPRPARVLMRACTCVPSFFRSC
jgi:hypothetical protein